MSNSAPPATTPAVHATPTSAAYGTEKKSGFVLNVVVIIAVFAIFAIILTIAYLPQRATALTKSSTSETTPEQRATTLTEMRAKEKSAATTYGWVDQTKGTVRLPIDRAVELTIQELNNSKK